MKKKRNFAALIPAAALLLLLGISPLFAAAEQDTTASGGPHTKENGEKYRFSFVDYDEYMPASRQFYYILTGLEESGWIAEGSLPFTIADVEAQHFSTAQMYAALEQADLGSFIAFAEGAFHYMGYEDKEDISSDLKSRAGKDIDLVIAFGTVPGVFVKNLDLPIPMTDFSATDPVASGIIDSATTGSGNPNVWAQVEPSLPMRQLKYYHLVRPFSKLGVVIYGDEIISGVPDIEASAREIGFELVKYNIAMQPRETAEEQDQYYELVGQQIRSIAGEGIDAFFLTVDLINDLSRMQDLLNPLYDRRIPVYLMDDVDALRHGALMLINANDYVNVGRFVADAIGQILDGAEAGSLPCVYASAPGIYVNYDVAKRIGYTLNFEFLTVCDEIYTEGGAAMKNEKKGLRRHLLVLILLAVFALWFVSTMGYLNYCTSALELEEHAIWQVERETVSGMETSISFGKSLDSYYGMDKVFAGFSLYCDGTDPFVLDREGRLLSQAEDTDLTRLHQFLQSKNVIRDFAELPEEGGSIALGALHGIFTPIREDGAIIGWFGCLYPESIYDASFVPLQRRIAIQTAIIIAAECIALAVFAAVTQSEKWRVKHGGDRTKEKQLTVVIISAGILLLSISSLYAYQADYRTRIKNSISVALHQLEKKMDHVQSQGVDLREVDGIADYLYDHLSSITSLRSVTVAEQISEIRLLPEESDLITYTFSSPGRDEILYMQAEVSDTANDAKMRSIILMLLSTMIILMVFVMELNNLVELSFLRHTRREDGLSEKQVSLSLRFTGFLCSTAEYMCVPYAAMLIRDSGEALFGLSLGVTAALPLTLEVLTQVLGMLLLPRFVRKFNVRAVLVFSTILMIACNLTAFALGGTLVIVLCRALAGIAYAGFKQVSNYLITRGYTSEAGRGENISQDNAGLLAGATCGAGLGAILSANLGYSATFLISVVVFGAYLAGTLLFLPWGALTRRDREMETAPTARNRAIQPRQLLRMAFSREMLSFILLIGIPLNIGVMLCVTLIPAICQARGISSVMLSYCYIANGLAGIYIGPALVSAAKRRFGLQPCIAFAFALTGFSIFILHIPPVAVMIVITSMVLGFLDGFVTPLATDRFMSLRVIRQTVDESTALVFSVVLSYVLLTFAPMIAELLLLPGDGLFSPMMAGAAFYATIAVLLLFFRSRQTPRNQD